MGCWYVAQEGERHIQGSLGPHSLGCLKAWWNGDGTMHVRNNGSWKWCMLKSKAVLSWPHHSLALGWMTLPLAGLYTRRAGPAHHGSAAHTLKRVVPALHHGHLGAGAVTRAYKMWLCSSPEACGPSHTDRLAQPPPRPVSRALDQSILISSPLFTCWSV